MTQPLNRARTTVGLAVAGLACTLAMCRNTIIATPAVSVEIWNSAHGCFQVSPDDQSDPPSATGESAPDTCTTTSVVTSLAGGADVVRLIIDYGTVDFSASTTPPTPTVTLTLDGVTGASNAVITELPQPNVPSSSGASAVFLATFTAPARNADTMWINVSAGQGFSHTPIGPFAVQAPSVVVAFPQCSASDACSSDGVVAVQVTAAGTLGETATLEWAYNGVPEPVAPVTTLTLNEAAVTVGTISATGAAYDPPVTTVTGVAFLPLPLPLLSPPSAGSGSPGVDGGPAIGLPLTQGWAVLAQVGAYVGATPYPGTVPAPVTVAISGCTTGATCSFPAGTASTLATVTALQGAGTTALLAWSATGGSQATITTGMPVTLASLGSNTQLAASTASVPLPPGPVGSTWVLTAIVGGYSGSSAPVELTQPPLAPLEIDPPNPSTVVGGQIVFTAAGGAGLPYTWACSGVSGGTCIDPAGNYTAGANAGEDTVTVTDFAGNTAISIVSVYPLLTATAPATLAVSQSSVTLQAAGGSGGPFVWSYATNGNQTGGTLTAAGVYSPGPVAATDIVEVHDSVGDTKSIALVVTE